MIKSCPHLQYKLKLSYLGHYLLLYIFLKAFGYSCLEKKTSFYTFAVKRIIESVLRPPDSFQVTTTDYVGLVMSGAMIVVQLIWVISGSKPHTPRIHLCFVFTLIYDYPFYMSFQFDIVIHIGGRHCLITLLLIEHVSSLLHVLMPTYTILFSIGYWCVVPQKHVLSQLLACYHCDIRDSIGIDTTLPKLFKVFPTIMKVYIHNMFINLKRHFVVSTRS